MPTVRKIRKGSTSKTATKSRPSSLPTSLNIPPIELLSYVILIFGRKAIGKTTLASMLARGKKKVLVIMLEKARKNLKIFQLPKQGEKYPNWKRVKEYVDDFIKSTEFDVIVFDTLDRLYDLCFEHVCKKYDVKSPSELGRDGSGVWVEIAAEFNELLLDLANSGKRYRFFYRMKKFVS